MNPEPHISKRTPSHFWLMLALLWALAGPAQAYLGGFEDLDGYNNDYLSGAGPFGNGASGYNVFYYNAGAYGTNAGGPGGGPVDIPNNTGLWSQLDAVAATGNRYAIAHAQIGAEHSYVGDAMLGLRNTATGASDLNVRYSLDSRDFGGVTPGTSLASAVLWSLRVCPDPVSFGPGLGLPVFYWAFRDSSLDAGLLLGWDQNNKMLYKSPTDAAWTYTNYTLDHLNYDRLELQMDSIAKTWSLSAFDVSANADVTVVSSGILAASMDALTTIDWTLARDQAKTYFDESSFSVIPEPSSAVLCLLAYAAVGRRRRRVQG